MVDATKSDVGATVGLVGATESDVRLVGATVWLVDATVGATESDVVLVGASKLDVGLVGATVGLVGATESDVRLV